MLRRDREFANHKDLESSGQIKSGWKSKNKSRTKMPRKSTGPLRFDD